MRDPVQMAISALVDHIRSKVPALTSRVEKGWPDPQAKLVPPCASVTHGDADRLGIPAREISRTPVLIEVEVGPEPPDEGDEEPEAPEEEGEDADVPQTQVTEDPVNVDVAYEVADYTVPVQIDLWGRNRTERGEIGAAIRSLFTDPDVGDDLRLVLSGYHGRLATFQIEPWRDEDNADAAQRGEWRQTIQLTLEVPEVAVKRQPLIKTIGVTVDASDQPIT